jgi:hypothetical protein
MDLLVMAGWLMAAIFARFGLGASHGMVGMDGWSGPVRGSYLREKKRRGWITYGMAGYLRLRLTGRWKPCVAL